MAQLVFKFILLVTLIFNFTSQINSICLNEKHRPQLHFSPVANWINDPNGMVYYRGQYHLFYQYHPFSNIWGPMHWGHAVSTDMVHWTELPIALAPDTLGAIFSGSAVVDHANVSGLATSSDVDPIIAIFTHAGAVQQQSIAYSNDLGVSFTKYANNPVLPNIDPVIPDIRDPKVFEYSPGVWIMSLAVGDRITFYESRNLIDWVELSSFGASPPVGSHGGVWECPDLLKFEYQGQTLWILFVSINPGGPNGGSATQYFLGDFNGREFRSFPLESYQWLDYGPDNYAGVTFANEPFNRSVYIAWMNNWNYANEVPTGVGNATNTWRGQMTLPRILNVAYVDGKVKLISTPAPEIESLRNSSQYFQQPITPIVIQPSSPFPINNIAPFRNPLMEVDLSFDLSRLDSNAAFVTCFFNQILEEICITYERARNQVYLDRGKSGNIDFSSNFNERSAADRMTSSNTLNLKIYTDVSSVEVFIDGGFSTLTGVFFPEQPFTLVNVTMFSDVADSRLVLNSAVIRGLNSIYDC